MARREPRERVAELEQREPTVIATKRESAVRRRSIERGSEAKTSGSTTTISTVCTIDFTVWPVWAVQASDAAVTPANSNEGTTIEFPLRATRSFEPAA